MDDKERLPPNWSSRLDERYNRRYYYNKVTKESTWIRPTAGPTTAREQRSSNARSSSSNTEHVDEEGHHWQRVYSKTYDRFYYYNKQTRETSWVHPSKTRQTQIDSHKNSSRSTTQSIAKSANTDDVDSSDDDDVDRRSRQKLASLGEDNDPDVFQKKVMDQFPALKKAFQELEEGQRKLQQEKAEHEARMRRELEALNAKLDELRMANGAAPRQPSEQPAPENPAIGSTPNGIARQSVGAYRPRKLTLEQDLKRFSLDLERRSISVVEKRKSVQGGNGIRPDDLKRVVEEANRLAAERGDQPATEETAAKQVQRISMRFRESKASSDEGDIIEDIKYEMDEVAHGIEYAVKEAAAQNQAAQEVKEAGVNSEYYELLGVNPESTEPELKKAYRRKLIEWHPDKVRSDKRDQAVKMTDLIQSAFKVLNDPWEREIYDWFGFEQYLLHVKVIACFKNYLVAGIELIKHPRKGRPRKRVVWLDREFTEILTYRKRIMEDQRTGKEKIKGIPIQTISDVTTGLSTEVLRRTGKSNRAGRYFSIVCKDRTMDFECPTEETCMFIATRMKLLIIDLKRDREWMHRHYDEMEQAEE